MKNEFKLLPEVADKYSLKEISPGLYCFPGFGEIDLTSITLEKADSLTAQGFPYLVAKKKKLQASDPE